MRLKKFFQCMGVLFSAFLLAPSIGSAASNEEMMKKIDMLQSQIDQLKGQLTAVETKTEAVAEAKGVELTPGSAASRAKEFFSKSEIHAFADAGYVFNTTSDKANPIGVFHKDDNDFFANGELVLLNPAEKLWDVGFRTDVHFGTDIADAITALGSDADDFDFEQVYVESIVPFFDKEVKLTAGKFITHMGWEYIDGYDALNDNITRSVAFGFGIPFTHTGIKANYKINDNAEFTLIGSNGWDNVDDNNDAKTVGTQLILNLADNLTLYANGIAGPEQTEDDNDWRYVANLILEYAMNDQWTFVLDGGYGHEDDVDSIVAIAPAIIATTIGGVTALDAATVAFVAEDDADWGWLVGYVRYQLDEKWALITRGEVFFDDDGARTGLEQAIAGVTETVEYAINDNARLRLEGRYDHSDEKFFDEGSDKDQFVVALNAQLRF